MSGARKTPDKLHGNLAAAQANQQSGAGGHGWLVGFNQPLLSKSGRGSGQPLSLVLDRHEGCATVENQSSMRRELRRSCRRLAGTTNPLSTAETGCLKSSRWGIVRRRAPGQFPLMAFGITASPLACAGGQEIRAGCGFRVPNKFKHHLRMPGRRRRLTAVSLEPIAGAELGHELHDRILVIPA